MGSKKVKCDVRPISPFNGPVEMGLRCLAILDEAFPSACSLQRLVAFDYLTVHSDDAPDGPEGIHPRTPHRGGELLVRRENLRRGLMLYQSRGLLAQEFQPTGLYFAATERSSSFLDALDAEYVTMVRQRAAWVLRRFGPWEDQEIADFIHSHIGAWGAEFEWSSVLWTEEDQL